MGRKLDNNHTYRLLSAEHLCGGSIKTIPIPFIPGPASLPKFGPYSKHPIALGQGQWQDRLQEPIENYVWPVAK